MDNNIIYNHLSNTNINKHNKTTKLDKLDLNYESDSQTINNFDDEYGEVFHVIKINNKDKASPKSNKTSKYRNNSYDKIVVNKSLQNLLEIDTNNKQEVLNILLNDNLIKKNEPDKLKKIKEINRNKYSYIESRTKPNLITKPKNTYGRKGFLLDIDENNPEFIKDMNYATYKLKKRIQNENEKVAKLLFNDYSISPILRQSISLKEFGKKIKNAIDKKRKHIQKIELQLYEQEKLEQTFSPSIKHLKKYGSRRSFEIFIRDQNAFQRKIKMKKKNLMIKSQSEKQLLFVGHPTINKKSEKIVKKLDFDTNVYERLYKRNTYNTKKQKNNNMNYLEYTHKLNQTSNISKSKKNKYSHVHSKIDIWKQNYKTNNRNDSRKKSLSKKSRSTNDLFESKKIFTSNDLPTNKMLYNKFNKKFDIIINNITKNKINNMNGSNIDTKNIDDIDEHQYCEILYNLGMVDLIKEKNVNEKIDINNNSTINGEFNKFNKTEIMDINSPNLEEKKLITSSFNILKLNNSKIKISNLKLFLTFVLNLHNYYFYTQYKTSHNEEEINKLFPSDKYKSEEIPLMIIKKYNDELKRNIDKSNPNNTNYFYISKNDINKIIITLDNYHHIKKDFTLFNINYLNYKKEKSPKKIIKLNNLKNLTLQKNNTPRIKEGFNTTIKRKTNNNNEINKSQNNITNIAYFERILLLEKRRQLKIEKRKQELFNKQNQECTFKPKINTKRPSYVHYKNSRSKKIKNLFSLKNKDDKKFSRIEELYQKGKRSIKVKKNREIYEIEIEEQMKKGTFKPNVCTTTTNKKNQKNKINIDNIDIYNEKQYRSWYERLKKGRMNQLVKNSNNDRYELSDELKKFVKDCQEENSLNYHTYSMKADSCYYYHNNDMYINDNQNTEENIIKNCNLYVNINNKDKKNNIKDEKEMNYKTEKNKKINKFEKKKKEQKKSENNIIKKNPLFILDINIKDDLKKQLCVYEGDSPKNLAAIFAKENNLNIEAQNKLENLIQIQMGKPLTKIDEENCNEQDKI